MENLIRFTSLSSELNDEEFNKFLVQTSKIYGRDLFTRLFFQNFKGDPEGINPFTNIVTEIINSRKKKPNQHYSYSKLDELPSALIAECASFLTESEYFSFNECNRKIYISCNSPSKLYKLSCSSFKRYPQLKSMKRFKFVKQIDINIPYFNQNVTASNKAIWINGNSFHKLTISNKGGDENEAKQFFDCNIIENNNIQTIKFQNFGTTTNPYNGSSFCNNILSKLSNLEGIKMVHTCLTNTDIKDQDIQKWLQNLKKIGCVNMQMTDHWLFRAILRVIGHKVTSIAIQGLTYIDIPSKGFPNLHDLELRMININILNAFNNVTTLKRVLIITGTPNVMKTCIDRMIQNQLSLEYLQINVTAKHLKDAMGYAESALFECRKNKKFPENKRLHIVFYVNHWRDDMIDNMHLVMTRLINAFYIANIKHFRLYFIIETDAKFDAKVSKMSEWLKDIENMKQNYLVQYQFTTRRAVHTFLLAVSNKDCVINGYVQRIFDV